MFDTGSDDSKPRRLLRAAMPVTPLTGVGNFGTC